MPSPRDGYTEWCHDGLTYFVETTRAPGQTYDQWMAAHAAAVALGQSLYPENC